MRKIREKVTGKLLSLDRALEAALPALLAILDIPLEDEQWTRLDPPQRRQAACSRRSGGDGPRRCTCGGSRPDCLARL